MFRELLKEILESYNKVEEPIYEHKELIEETQDILSEASFSKAHIDALKKAYGGIKKINPDSEAYKKLVSMLNSMPDNQLKTLAKSDVPFVSALARNRVISRGLKLESLDEVSKATLDSYMKKARKDMRDRYYDDSEENDKKFFKRSRGIETALKKKWAKNEEHDLEEAKSVEDQIADIEKMLKSFGGNTSSAKMKRYALEKKLASLKSMKEEFSLDEASGYTVNHKTFSSAVQHARDVAEKRGFQVDDDDWDRKVALGPKKPSSGKTNNYSINLMKNGKSVKQKLQMQVYYDEGRYELNMYIQ